MPSQTPPSEITLSDPQATRQLRVFAFDPSLSTEMANYEVSEVVTRIPWERDRCWEGNDGKLVTERGLLPGPTGDYVEVIDIDPASECTYAPVDLNDPYLLATNGLPPSEGNPQFHQQMVYAVAMNTIQHFEHALGRQIYWSDGYVDPKRWQARLLSRAASAHLPPCASRGERLLRPNQESAPLRLLSVPSSGHRSGRDNFLMPVAPHHRPRDHPRNP